MPQLSSVKRLDSAIHRIKLYPVDVAISFLNTYPLDSDLSSGLRSPTFEQPWPDQKAEILHSRGAVRATWTKAPLTDALYISLVKSNRAGNLTHNE